MYQTGVTTFSPGKVSALPPKKKRGKPKYMERVVLRLELDTATDVREKDVKAFLKPGRKTPPSVLGYLQSGGCKESLAFLEIVDHAVFFKLSDIYHATGITAQRESLDRKAPFSSAYEPAFFRAGEVGKAKSVDHIYPKARAMMTEEISAKKVDLNECFGEVGMGLLWSLMRASESPRHANMLLLEVFEVLDVGSIAAIGLRSILRFNKCLKLQAKTENNSQILRPRKPKWNVHKPEGGFHNDLELINWIKEIQK